MVSAISANGNEQNFKQIFKTMDYQ